ncbi:MAG: glycosyltransferase family 39 protein [Coleofasciculus sp. G3-WIS-01]|uniref:glycosyltransferase family 39 protein n=1 Tax=Coleofasciculus sp. G3-WIS-01 TaxID=3069528 RepID=UPI0032F4BF6A
MKVINAKTIDYLKKLKTIHLLFVIILIFGIFLRFANLDQKVYNADEVRKIIWLSGHSSEAFKEEVYRGNIVSAEELKRYQYPSDDTTLADVFKVLSGKTEHVPLHHIISRFWLQLFVTHSSAKVVSVLLSFLYFPCLYWLCIELFQSPLTGWVSIAIVSISPFHILASQNAGSYSLWTVTILLCSAALLRALRVQAKTSWLMYAITLTLGFYTHLFSVVVALGQAIYVILIEKLKLTKTLINYGLSCVISIVLFSPWIVIFFVNLGRVDEGTSYYDQFNISFRKLIMFLYSNIGHVFIDFYHRYGRVEKLLYLCLFLLITYSLYHLVRKTQINVWLFIVILITLTPILHIIANFITPSALHIQSRYYLPSHLGIQLSVAYLLASQMGSTSLKVWQRRVWSIIFLIIITLGMISGTILMQEKTAGLDDQRGTASGKNLAVAPYLNQAENPLVISETTHSFILALLYLIDNDVKFQLLQPDNVQQWQQKLNLVENISEFSDVFVFYPDPKFKTFIEQNENITIQVVVNGLDKINLKN